MFSFARSVRLWKAVVWAIYTHGIDGSGFLYWPSFFSGIQLMEGKDNMVTSRMMHPFRRCVFDKENFFPMRLPPQLGPCWFYGGQYLFYQKKIGQTLWTKG